MRVIVRERQLGSARYASVPLPPDALNVYRLLDDWAHRRKLVSWSVQPAPGAEAHLALA
jgi:hypothetical protein